MSLLTEQEIAKQSARIDSLTSAGAEYQRQCFEQAAEISKLDARIEELEADQTKAQAAVKIGNYIGKNYLIAWCDNVLADQVTDLLQKQAIEISRLKGVIAKCKTAFVDINNEAKCFMAYENARNNFSEDSYEAKAYSKAAIKASESTKEALAAIKEIEK